MLSIQEIKLVIDKLNKLKDTDFQKNIEDSLNVFKEYYDTLELANRKEIESIDKTVAWYLEDLDWRARNNDKVQNDFITKQVQMKIGQFAKMGNILQNCLEIGPGYGKFTGMLRAWRLIFCVDVIEKCKSKILEPFPRKQQNLIRFYTTNRCSCPDIPTGSVHFVFSWDTFTFFTQKHIHEYLEEIKRVMIPGAYGFLHYADCNYDQDLAEAKRGYWNYNTKEKMTELVRLNGFEVLETEQFMPKANYIIFKKPGNQNQVVYQISEIPLDKNNQLG